MTDHAARISADAPVRIEYGTSTGYGVYASAPVTAAIAAGDGTWQGFEEGRAVTAAGGPFNHAIAPLAVHVYVYVLPPPR